MNRGPTGWHRPGGRPCPGIRVVSCLLALLPLFGLAAAEIRVAVYNVENYFIAEGEHRRKLKAEPDIQALLRMVVAADADVLMLCEVGGAESLADLAARLRAAGHPYPYTEYFGHGDSVIGLGMLARLRPAAVLPRGDLAYSIRPKREFLPLETVPVQRGFLHAVFDADGYRLHVVMAHLKSRIFHPRYHQTDMRRYEARLLRHYADEILRAEPEANLLVMGDFNDTADSDPLTILRAASRPSGQRLYDLRPADPMGLFWTHWWHQQDIYGRIDYLLASHAVLPEIVPEGTRIVHLADAWMAASDHRLLVATVVARDCPPLSPETVGVRFPGGIRQPERRDGMPLPEASRRVPP